MFVQYLKIGYEHVVPLGYDHILFIIDLFFYDSKLKTAAIQCTLFTLAHTLTLILVALGYVNLNTKLVETCIAVSICLVAIENFYAKKLNVWRLLVVFIFGLIHGIGFAGALKDFGLPQEELIPALVGFNSGVEIAQLSLIALLYFTFTRYLSHKIWYKEKITNPLSLLISGIAVFWFITRILK